MQRISIRNGFLSLFAVLSFSFSLPASADLLDYFRSGSTSTSTSGTTTTSGSTSTTSTATTTYSVSSQTVTYTPTNWSQQLQGDLYLPSNNVAARPVVLLLHGGAWQRGDKSSYAGLGKSLASRGYAAFAINYRFAPGSTYPAQLVDMQQAVRFLQANASKYRLDMNRLATWGYSAGGHLAALLAVQPASDIPPVRVTIAGGAPSDLTAPEARDASSVKIFMGGSYAQIPALYAQASPRVQVRTGMSPTFLYHGTTDTTVPYVQSENFAKTLQAASVPVELVRLDGLDHSQASGATAKYRDKAFAFLDRHIGGGAGLTSGSTTSDTTTGTTTGTTSGTTTGTTSGTTTGTTTTTSGTSTGGTTTTTSGTTTTSSTSTYQVLKSFLSR
ncbi:MAG: lipase [Moraxellaceae bacterium]|nr:lipase [Moraxellaceae bacterium]